MMKNLGRFFSIVKSGLPISRYDEFTRMYAQRRMYGLGVTLLMEFLPPSALKITISGDCAGYKYFATLHTQKRRCKNCILTASAGIDGYCLFQTLRYLSVFNVSYTSDSVRRAYLIFSVK